MMRLVHPLLNKIFLKDDKMTCHSDIFEIFSIIFRVAGPINNFGNGNGCERMKKLRGRHGITIDYVIPQNISDNIEFEEFRIYIVNAVEECFSLMKEKAIKMKYKIDEEKLDEDFKKGIDDFLVLSCPSDVLSCPSIHTDSLNKK